MTVSTYRDDRGSGRQQRVVLDVARARIWVAFGLAVLAFFGSAASGVLATANHVVPPIALASLKPALDQLVAADLRLETKIDKVERDGAVRDEANVQALRQQMAELQTQLRETSRVTNELLLQLARSGRR